MTKPINKQETIKTADIYKIIPAIMAEIEAVPKGRKNKEQGYSFRGIDDMYNALHDHMAKHGLFCTSEVLEISEELRKSRSGGIMTRVRLQVRFTFFAGSDGSSIVSIMPAEAMDSSDKATNKAMSAALKYALMQLFMIPTAEAKDSENEAPESVSQVEIDPDEVERGINKAKNDGDNPIGFDSYKLGGVEYTRRKGISKSGKPYCGWFPPNGEDAPVYWSDESFARVLVDRGLASPDDFLFDNDEESNGYDY